MWHSWLTLSRVYWCSCDIRLSDTVTTLQQDKFPIIIYIYIYLFNHIILSYLLRSLHPSSSILRRASRKRISLSLHFFHYFLVPKIQIHTQSIILTRTEESFVKFPFGISLAFPFVVPQKCWNLNSPRFAMHFILLECCCFSLSLSQYAVARTLQKE